MKNLFLRLTPNRYVFAGICAITMALGFIRFDLGLLASVMAQSHWIKASEIGDLAAWGMLGAIGGCFTQANIKNQTRSIQLIKWFVLIIPVTFFLQALHPNIVGMRLIQFSGGWISGSVTTAIPSIILSFIKDEHKANASTQIWMGGGVGAIVGALVIDALGRAQSPAPILSFIGFLSGLMCIPVIKILGLYQQKLKAAYLSRQELTDTTRTELQSLPNQKKNEKVPPITLALITLSAGFVLMNISQVPFLAMQQTIIVDRLNISTTTSASAYIWLGLGSLLGSIIPAALIQRGVKIRILLQVISLLGIIAGLLFTWGDSLAIFSAAAILYGFWEMCTASLTAGRIFELVPASSHAKTWGMTGVFGQSSFAIIGFTSQASNYSGINSILYSGLIALALHAICEFIQARGIAK